MDDGDVLFFHLQRHCADKWSIVLDLQTCVGNVFQASPLHHCRNLQRECKQKSTREGKTSCFYTICRKSEWIQPWWSGDVPFWHAHWMATQEPTNIVYQTRKYSVGRGSCSFGVSLETARAVSPRLSHHLVCQLWLSWVFRRFQYWSWSLFSEASSGPGDKG